MTAQSTKVRLVRSDEREILVSFMTELNRVEHDLEPDRDLTLEAADQHLSYLEELVRDSGGFVTVAETAGCLAGFLVGILEAEDGTYIRAEEREYGYISDLFIAKEARRRGLGRILLEDAETRFRDLGMKKVRITALVANTAAMEAYRNSGYRPLETTFDKELS